MIDKLSTTELAQALKERLVHTNGVQFIPDSLLQFVAGALMGEIDNRAGVAKQFKGWDRVGT